MVVTELGDTNNKACLGGKVSGLEIHMGHPNDRELRASPGSGEGQDKH